MAEDNSEDISSQVMEQPRMMQLRLTSPARENIGRVLVCSEF